MKLKQNTDFMEGTAKGIFPFEANIYSGGNIGVV
jgi:hypothetical protein